MRDVGALGVLSRILRKTATFDGAGVGSLGALTGNPLGSLQLQCADVGALGVLPRILRKTATFDGAGVGGPGGLRENPRNWENPQLFWSLVRQSYRKLGRGRYALGEAYGRGMGRPAGMGSTRVQPAKTWPGRPWDTRARCPCHGEAARFDSLIGLRYAYTERLEEGPPMKTAGAMLTILAIVLTTGAVGAGAIRRRISTSSTASRPRRSRRRTRRRLPRRSWATRRNSPMTRRWRRSWWARRWSSGRKTPPRPKRRGSARRC